MPDFLTRTFSTLFAWPVRDRSALFQRWRTAGPTIACYAGAPAFLVLSLGLWADQSAVPLTQVSRLPLRLSLAVVSGLGSACAAGALARDHGRLFAFRTALFILLTLSSLYGANGIGSLIAPRWPAIGLHGYKPTQHWMLQGPDVIGFNSWGQRDHERLMKPPPGVKRIAFVGDSFIDESGLPLPARVESLLGRQDAEIINLGISDSAPDQYFYRVKNIALPLGVTHVVLFLYAGNDFIQAPTLRSRWGIAAVYPRDSALSLLRLHALNHLLTNRDRPFMRAWGQADAEYRKEGVRHKTLAAASDRDMPGLLASYVGEADRRRLLTYLEERDLSELYEGIRRPDEGLFRSYYLEAALKAAIGRRKPTPRISEEFCYGWGKKTADICRARGVKFTLVRIPEAFQVDGRMRRQYAGLTDMRALFGSKNAAGNRLLERARMDSLDSVDLYSTLVGIPGTYLNLDGHWSEQGLDLIARHLTPVLKNGLEP